uniref:Glycosyltransferase N-terminal domain-containing protein n=1 Tax=Araucaria cunninghamii TaxID=56994 RepID=A0A0D6QR55_ARACU
MEQAGKKPLHLLMFPWLAHGHIPPFLELSKRLANDGVKISFLSTPSNITKIRPSLISSSSSGMMGQIDLLQLPLPFVDGLPPQVENTADVPNEMEGLLKKALDSLEKPFENLLERISPDYVIYDFSQYWAATVAARLGIPSVFFHVMNASVGGYVLSPSRSKEEYTVQDLITPPPGYPSSAIALHPFEARHSLGAFNSKKGEIGFMDRCLKSIQGCSLIAIKSCYEIEGKFIRYLEETWGKSVVPVGLLGPRLPERGCAELSEEESKCLGWLDKQTPSSVIYVAFGSEVFLNKQQIRALALGLEATGLPFLWVLRFPRYTDDNNNDVSEETARAWAMLPEGFQSRTRERGFIHMGWAPQVHILSHPSVGVFVSHSGWSSVLEAVRFGVRNVLLPMVNDQPLDARLFANELKVAVEVEREADGSFTEKHIRKAVVNVMEEKTGSEIMSNINEMKRSVYDDEGFEEKYVRGFIECLASRIS